MIEFETPKPIQMLNTALETVAVNMMRPKSRYFDEHEHEIPWDYINFMHMAMRQTGAGSLAPAEKKPKEGEPEKEKRPPIGYQQLALHAGDAFLGRLRHVPGHAGRRAGSGGGRSRRHTGAESRNSWRASEARSRSLAPWR